MIQDEFKDLIFKFVRHASVEAVAYIFLFGSVARGDADRRSDIDILVVIDTGNREFEELEVKSRVSELTLNLEKEYDRNIQVIFTNRNYDGLDSHLIEEVLKKGILLYAKSPAVVVQGLELEPYVVIIYSLENLNSQGKMRVKRILYGHKTRKVVGGRTYGSEKEGLVRKLQGLRLGAGVIAIPQKNIPNLKEELDKLRVPFKEIDLWLPKDSIKKLRS